MPINFDPNKYKQIAQREFGQNAFNFSNLSNRGSLQAEAERLRKQLEGMINDRMNPKKTYSDAVNYISQNKDQFLNPDLNGGKSGAYQIANEIRNDPAKQAEIKAQGYNVSDYINALYAGLSGGNFRSEREYKQNVSHMNKVNADKIKAYKDKHGMTPDQAYQLQKAQQKQPKKSSSHNLFGDLLNRVERNTANVINSAGLGIPNWLAEHAPKALQNVGLPIAPGINVSPKTMTNAQKPSTTTSGKVMDTLSNLAGYAVPGELAVKGAKLLKAGKGAEKGLKTLGAGSKLAKLGGIGAEGAVAGGLFGTGQQSVDAALHPNSATLKQRMAQVGFDMGLGLVGDPLLHGVGNLLSKLKRVKPEVTAPEPLALPPGKVAGYLNEGQRLSLPEGKMVTKPRFESPTNQSSGEVLALPPHNPSANQILDYLLPKIKPEVEQAMTPPLENPRELKKWIREHTDIPIKQLDTLPPNDLHDIAIQVRNSLRVPDVAQEIAHKYGYDLEALLNGKVQDMNGVINRRNFAETAGIPQNKLNMDILNNPQAGSTFKPKERYVPMDKQPLNYVGKNTKPLSLKVQPVIKETAPLNFSKKALMDKNLVNPLQTKLNPNKEVAATAEKVKKNPDYINVSSEPGLVKASTKNAELEKLLSNSDNWKDKGNLSYGRETMDRNFEDVMGKDAPKMKKVFLDPIKENETSRVKFLNAEREQVKSYGIKPKSQDDKLVQMFGEGKISLAELKQQTPNWKKVVKVANAYRAKYDELLTNVNKVLEANGYDPIPKRANYFPHYEEIDGLLHKLGFDMNNNMLPTDINGLTDSFKPGKNFFRNALQRKGDQTTFGAIEGFDKYIEGISNVIYHTKDIKNIRALEKAIRNKYEGDTHLSNFVTQLDEYGNILAGKKSKIDRAAEFFMGRKVYNALDTIRRRVGANIIGANISSALSNFIPFTQSLATTDKQSFAKAMFDTLANVVKKDGIVNESGFLTRRIGSDPLYRNLWDKTVDKSMWLMKTLDKFSSQVIVRSKYYEGLKKGLSPKEAMKQADDWAGKLMADRSKGQMPPMFNSKTLGVLSQFQLEVNNQLSFLLKDIPRTMDKKAAASAFAQVALYSYLFNDVYEKMMGRRPAFDPLGVALQAYKDYNNDNITKSKASVNLFENVANQLPFTSALTGGRYPISAGLPSVPNLIDAAKQNQFSQQLKKEAVKPLFDLLPPTGGNQVKKTYEGLTTLGKGGEYLGNKMKYPISNTPGNELRGALFGKYAFPEANQYYNNSRRILDPKQTKQVEQSSNPKQTYEDIQFKRRETTLLSQIQKVVNSNKSQKEKNNQVNELQKRLQRLREGR